MSLLKTLSKTVLLRLINNSTVHALTVNTDQENMKYAAYKCYLNLITATHTHAINIQWLLVNDSRRAESSLKNYQAHTWTYEQ